MLDILTQLIYKINHNLALQKQPLHLLIKANLWIHLYSSKEQLIRTKKNVQPAQEGTF